eukprot:7290310-Ditylum_brightwellii.AAC.1
MKVNKTPLKTNPIVSHSSSLFHCLGLWVDFKLQPIAALQKSFIQSSYELKQQLQHKTLPNNAKLFTADDVS